MNPEEQEEKYMAVETNDKRKTRPGIPLSEAEQKESDKCWKDINESIELVYKKSKKK